MLGQRTTFVLIALGTVVGLAGTDLVLPAIPDLPADLSSDLAASQLVLAAFAAGTGVGLLGYGELGTRCKLGNLLVASLLAYAVLSLLSGLTSTMNQLIALRFLQGLVSAGPAVFAPVMIKVMYDEHNAVAALGRIGSIESMTPALAPILGAWLLTTFDWRFSFYLTALIALCLSLIWLFAADTRHKFGFASRSSQGYRALLTDLYFLRYSFSQAFTLGALLIIVFAAPTVIMESLGGELRDFIIMQVGGVSFFVLAANTSHHLVQKFGPSKTILAGTSLTALGCLGICIVSLTGVSSKIQAVWVLFILVNTGLGVRGPSGFFTALQAAGDNESRGSALIVLLVMLTAALGTAAAAPFVDDGLFEVAALASIVAFTAVALSVKPVRGSTDR